MSNNVETLAPQYKKRSRLLESWNSIKTNPGAMFGLIVVALYVLMMIISFFVFSYEDVTAIAPKNLFAKPGTGGHLFGTDKMGRDLFARCLYGSRYSLAVGFGSVAIGFVVGTFFGSIAGFFGGWVEQIIMRATDVLSAIPGTLLCMVLVSMWGAGLGNLLISIGISCISGFIRISRASILTTKSNEYVEAARAIGMPELRIIFSQVLPNSLSPLIVTASSRLATCILSAAGLSFLGFGVPVPLPEWGALISDGRNYLQIAPHLATFPGLFIVVLTFACSLLGDGLRDALDPRLKK